MTTKVFSVAEMVDAERAADASGVSYAEMMETAGRRVAEAIAARRPVANQSILIMVGPGNNGGDGLVAGRYLAEMGAEVTLYLYKPRDPQTDRNFQLVAEMGLFVIEAEHDQRYRALRGRLSITNILVDALLGTGVTRPISGRLADLMREVKAAVPRERSMSESDTLLSIAKLPLPTEGLPEASDLFVVAVDCPSGLNCDTGALDPLSLAADLTVTFAGPKRGHFRFPGAQACGELVVADIHISDKLPEVAAVLLTLVTPQLARSLLPDRPLGGHKGTFGTVLVAAGSAQYWGAPLLSGRGAYRAGAGLVALAVPQAIRATVAGQLPEATYPPVPATRVLDAQSAEQLLSVGFAHDALLIGPGLDGADSFLEYLLSHDADLPPLVIDADGLNILARRPQWLDRLPPNSILTPHPGEMARLLNQLPAEIEAADRVEIEAADRVEIASTAAMKWNQVVLLKGAFTVIAAPDGRAALLPFANPLLAVGGSGDVLAGMIAANLAQGSSPYEAAILGAYMHGAAAQLASRVYGEAGLLAAEIADWVPRVRQRLLAR